MLWPKPGRPTLDRVTVPKGMIVLLAGLSFVPIWRSGGRDNLTFWGWVINHTIWGPPVEYIPEEDYEAALGSEIYD